MTSLVVDSWAWVEYLDGSPIGKGVDEAFRHATELWTSAVSVAEIVSKFRRKGRDESLALTALTTLSKVGEPTFEDAQAAGEIHSEVKPKAPGFSLADSFVLQLARRTGSKVLTGDPDFAGLKDAIVLKSR
ncbi:MAG: PIN domain-containing protein [Nitrososphaerota archaeon]|nr:PIN domain-containing protein [Nitrososphaerota archaeon]